MAEEEYSKLLRRAAPILELPRQVWAEAGRVDYDQRRLVAVVKLEKHLPLIVSTVSLDSFMKKIPSTVLEELSSFSDTLHEHLAQDGEVNLEEVDRLLELRRHVRGLIADVYDSESALPKELYGFILEHLRALELAIDQYQIEGLTGLLSVVERAYGGFVLRPHLQQQAQYHSLATRFQKVLYDLAAVATIGMFGLSVTQAWAEQPDIRGPIVVPIESRKEEPEEIVDAELVFPERDAESDEESSD